MTAPAPAPEGATGMEAGTTRAEAALARAKRRGALPSARHMGLALVSGALATAAILLSPLGQFTGPAFLPFLPGIDLRLITLPVGFLITLVATHRTKWPGPATGLVGAAVIVAAGSQLGASTVLDYIGIGWAGPGTRIGLLSLAGAIGSVLVALLVALEQGRDQVARTLTEAGLPEPEVARARVWGDEIAASALITSGLAVAVLALGLRILDQFTGRERLPLPEIFALVVVLGIGALLLGIRSAPRVEGLLERD